MGGAGCQERKGTGRAALWRPDPANTNQEPRQRWRAGAKFLSAHLPSQPTHGPKGERVEGSTVPRATTVGSTGSRRSRSPLTKRGHGRPPRRGLEGAQQCAPGTARRPAGPGSVSPRDQQRGRQRRFSQDGGAGCAAVRIRRGPSGLLAFPANSRQDPLSRGAEGTSQCASQYRDHGYV